MTAPKKLEFANYTLKFGNQVLLDLFEEIVWPSFLDGKYLREIRGGGEIFFMDTKIISLEDTINGTPILAITGRIMKATTVRRDQLLTKDRKIIEDTKVLDSYPSSIFTLILNNHRLIFSKECAGAPSINDFRITSQFCLTQRYKEFINELYQQNLNERKTNKKIPKITKKSLFEKYIFPELRVTPLPCKTDLEDFLKKFSIIKQYEIKLLPTNDEELQNDGWWKHLESTNNKMNGTVASVSFSNNKDGLNFEQVKNSIQEATAQANSELKIVGVDTSGDKMSGDNDEFKLTSIIPSLAKELSIASSQMYFRLKQLIQEGIISFPETRSIGEKIITIYNKFIN